MIIVSGGIKGGSGKSTIATNLAVVRASQGFDVLFVDADEQGTATIFTNIRNELKELLPQYTGIKLVGAAVRSELLKLIEKYDDIIIDVGGRDTTSQRAALSIADILLVPFVPRGFDVWTLGEISKVVEEMRIANPKLQAFSFLNRADSKGSDNSQASEALLENDILKFLDFPIGSRKAFGNAGVSGLAVTELKPADVKANKEITKLFEYVCNYKHTKIKERA